MDLKGSDPFAGKHSCRNYQWQWVEACPRTTNYLQQKHQIPEIIARLLAQRQVHPDHAESFLNPKLKDLMPDPFHLKDMDLAVTRVIKAIQAKEPIVIFGDYDVDGATSTALLKRFFDALSTPNDFYIPNRLTEGYGLTQGALQSLYNKGYRLVITVDCGTTSYEALNWAKEHHMDVIILDHHTSEKTLPPAFALVNPNRYDEASPYTYLCAAGLTFLFLTALKSRLQETFPSLPDLRGFLDLVALGTVCDVVPLIGLNRAYVSQGLKVISKQTNTGLKALFKSAAINEKASAYHLGFILGPRINAGGRIGESDLGAKLLSTDDPLLAEKISQRLEALNSERQTLEAIMLEDACKQVEEKGLHNQSVICVASDKWHMGIVGIIAGRLKDLYHRPCFAIAIDDQGIGKGSGRSIPGVDLGRLAHEACAEGLLINGGGHPMAAGITASKDRIEDFKEFLKTHIPKTDTLPTLPIHGALAISGVSLELIDLLDQLSPFGQENPSPNFVLTNVRVSYSNVVGSGHIRCILESENGHRLPAIAFREAETPLGQHLLSNEKNRPFHVVGTLKSNHWQGQSNPQFLIKDAMGI